MRYSTRPLYTRENWRVLFSARVRRRLNGIKARLTKAAECAAKARRLHDQRRLEAGADMCVRLAAHVAASIESGRMTATQWAVAVAGMRETARIIATDDDMKTSDRLRARGEQLACIDIAADVAVMLRARSLKAAMQEEAMQCE